MSFYQPPSKFGYPRYPVASERELVRPGPGRDGDFLFEADAPGIPRVAPDACIGHSDILLHESAAFALTQAAQHLLHVADERLEPVVGFRSVEQQRMALKAQVEETRDLEAALRREAPPGYSDLHTGLAVELARHSEALERVLPLFGWERSFPDNHPGTSLLHWRFVGAPVIVAHLADHGLSADERRLGNHNLYQLAGVDFAERLTPPVDGGSGRFTSAAYHHERLATLEALLNELDDPPGEEPCAGGSSEGHMVDRVSRHARDALQLAPLTSADQALLLLELYLPLTEGARSPRVRALQFRLKKIGYFKGPETGLFGETTRTAVEAYQQATGFPVTGVAGVDVLRHLRWSARSFAESLSAETLANITRGTWQVEPAAGNLGIRQFANGRFPNTIGDRDLVIGSSARGNWNVYEHMQRLEHRRCVGMIVDTDPPEPLPPSLFVLRVRAATNALGRLAGQARHEINGKFIAVTGSSGKTSTKELMRHVLEKQGTTICSPGTVNATLAICYKLINAPMHGRYYIFESGLGPTGSGIKDHSVTIRPHVAIITSVDPAHIMGYRDVEEIARRKADIFAGLVSGGYGIVDRDSPYYPVLAEEAAQHKVSNLIGVGWHPEAHYRLLRVTVRESGTEVTASAFGRFIRFRTSLIGRHWAKSALYVIAAAHVVGADWRRVADDLASFELIPGRGSFLSLKYDGRLVTVFDSHFNANPGSMRADLAAYNEVTDRLGCRKVGVIGCMGDLGDTAESAHRELAVPVQASRFDRLFLLGEDMRYLEEALDGVDVTRFGDIDEGKEAIAAALQDGDYVFLKGSRLNGLEALVEHLRSDAVAEDAA